MSEPKNISYAALEDIMNQLMDSATLASAPAFKDSVVVGTGALRFSAIIKPQWIHVHPRNFWLATKTLRGAGWYYKHTARWRYLVRRGARK